MGSILPWRLSNSIMLTIMLLHAWVLRSSFAFANFLTPVPDHGNVTKPDLCHKVTVISCNLFLIDIARLHDSSVDFMGVTLDFQDKPGDNTYTFSAGLGQEASFTVDSDLGVVWGHAQLADGRDFVIEPNLDNCDGCHVVIEENEEAFPQDHAETLPSLASEETRSDVAALLEKGKTDQTTVVNYTILVYYTPEVRDSVDDLRTFVDQAIATTNQGYINSKIPLRVKLHCLEETTVPEAYFTKNHDGSNENHMLHVFRDYNGGGNNLRRSADAAVLLMKDIPDMCGWGYVIRDGNYDHLAVSMMRYDCAEGGYTLGHELGHNLGLNHDKYESSLGSPWTPYSQGYHIPGTKEHTIMAYPHGEQRMPANVYSNPRLVVSGYRLGKDGEADAAKKMTEVRFAIAANGDESEACQRPGCIIEEQIAYFGSSIASGKVETQETCARLSLVTHGSYFWSYVPADRLCVLKSSDSGRTPYAGAVSGNSECGRNQTKV